MPTAITWEAGDGYYYHDELSDVLRTALQPRVYFRQFCEPDPGALEKGLHRGAQYFWTPFQIRSATGQHRRHGGVSGGKKGRGQGL